MTMVLVHLSLHIILYQFNTFLQGIMKSIGWVAMELGEHINATHRMNPANVDDLMTLPASTTVRHTFDFYTITPNLLDVFAEFIYAPQRMILVNSGDLMTFPLAPPLGQNVKSAN